MSRDSGSRGDGPAGASRSQGYPGRSVKKASALALKELDERARGGGSRLLGAV